MRAANDLSLKDAESRIFAININEKANIRVIYYVVKWIKTLSLSVSSFALTSLSPCFSLMYAFLYSKPFWNNWFFLIGIHSMQGWTATKRHGITRLQEKNAQKD